MNTKTRTFSAALSRRSIGILGAFALAGYLGAASAPAMAAGWSSSESTSSADKDYVQAEKRIEAGDYREAITLLTQVAERQPKNADVFNYLGYSNRKLGNYDVALTYYERALSLDPKHRGAHEYLGELYLSTGELAKAEAQLDRLDSICFFGCDEYRELKAKIADYKKRQASLPAQRSSVN